MSLFDAPPLTAWIASCLRSVCLGVSCLPVLHLSHEMKCVKAKKMERHTEIQRPLVCAARRMTKALPPDISLYLSQATSFHPLLITLFSCSVSLCLLPSLFSSSCCLCPTSRPCPHFMQLFLSSFLSFLPRSNTPPTHPLPPLPLCSSSNLPPRRASSSSCHSRHPPPHHVEPVCLSLTLHSSTLGVSSSMSSPQRVVITARLEVAETADSQAGDREEKKGR